MYRLTKEAQQFIDNSWDPPSEPAILPCSPKVSKDYLSEAKAIRRLVERRRKLKEDKSRYTYL